MRYILMVTMIWAFAASAVAADKVAPPAGAALTDASKLVADAYKADLLGAKTPDEKSALAQKLIDASKDEKGAAGRFALLSKATDLAVDSGNIKPVTAAIDEIDNVFEIDAMKLLTDKVAAAASNAQSPAQRRELVTGALRIADKAMAADRYETAKSLARVALSTARLANDVGTLDVATAKSQGVQETEVAYDQIKKILPLLADKPDDADANFKVGRFRCFFKGDWEKGLPMLALGNDETLKRLADNDIRGASEADGQVSIGDAWWDVAQRTTGRPGEQMKLRAASWYSQAVLNLGGLAKTRVEARLSEIRRGHDKISDFTIEAFVDDEAELHITPNGVYWKELGGFDKVGKAGGQDYPTYVNGTAWHPVWGKPKEHGLDQTEVLALPIGRLNFDFQVVAVGKERGAKGIERRSPVTMRNDKDEQVLSIPEKESGARWYAIRLFRKD